MEYECGRAIRFEEGKTAEIFTLVLKGCQDNASFQKSSEGMNYIEITEDELDDVLANKALNKTTKTQEIFKGFRL